MIQYANKILLLHMVNGPKKLVHIWLKVFELDFY